MPDRSDDPDPLIVTLVLDAVSQAAFDTLRSRHFPPERLHVGAHVTMFHALPGGQEATVARAIAAEAGACAPFDVDVTGLRFLGRGVAYALAASEALALRARLAQAFAPWLTPQDRAPWSAHVTVQNKVAPDLARRTHAVLAAAPSPTGVRATGVALWRYRGGPWDAVWTWPFAPGIGGR